MRFSISNFQFSLCDWWLRYLLNNCPQLNVTVQYWWYREMAQGVRISWDEYRIPVPGSHTGLLFTERKPSYWYRESHYNGDSCTCKMASFGWIKAQSRAMVPDEHRESHCFHSPVWYWHNNLMMTSSNGNIFRVTGHLCGEFTGDRWIPCTKANDAELWCFLWSEPD